MAVSSSDGEILSPNTELVALTADPAPSMVLEVVVTTVISSGFQMQGRIDFEHGLLD